MKKWMAGWMVFAFLAWIPATALADSAYVNLLIDGSAEDIGSGYSLEGGFSVYNGTGHFWNASTGYKTIDIATGTITQMDNPTSWLTNGGGDPFGLYDAYTNSFYAATYFDGGTSYVYQYDYDTSSWSAGVQSVNVYGGDFYNGDLYISGLREPWTGGYDSTYVSLFDFSGNGYHDALIETGGASAGVSLDNDGNVYYAAFTTTGDTALVRWTAAQVASVVNDLAGGHDDTYLTVDDGEILSLLPGGGNGITVDDDGNVYVTVNDLSTGDGYLLMWDGTSGAGDNYIAIAEGSMYPYQWLGPLDTDGDSIYGSMAWGAVITEITPVPVPAAVWLLASGLLGLVGIRRRRNG
jgi:hypothetical protein